MTGVVAPQARDCLSCTWDFAEAGALHWWKELSPRNKLLAYCNKLLSLYCNKLLAFVLYK